VLIITYECSHSHIQLNKKSLKKIQGWSLDTLLSEHLLHAYHGPAYWGKRRCKMSTWVACLTAIGDKSSTTRKALHHWLLSVLLCPLETNETLINLQSETTWSPSPFYFWECSTHWTAVCGLYLASLTTFCLEHYYRKVISARVWYDDIPRATTTFNEFLPLANSNRLVDRSKSWFHLVSS
jgi:hypothetical protein